MAVSREVHQMTPKWFIDTLILQASLNPKFSWFRFTTTYFWVKDQFETCAPNNHNMILNTMSKRNPINIFSSIPESQILIIFDLRLLFWSYRPFNKVHQMISYPVNVLHVPVSPIFQSVSLYNQRYLIYIHFETTATKTPRWWLTCCIYNVYIPLSPNCHSIAHRVRVRCHFEKTAANNFKMTWTQQGQKVPTGTIKSQFSLYRALQR